MLDNSVGRAPYWRFRDPGSNPCLVHHYFTHLITFGTMPRPGTDKLTPVRGNSLGRVIFEGKDHLRWEKCYSQIGSNTDSLVG